jgi:hypothetical protein
MSNDAVAGATAGGDLWHGDSDYHDGDFDRDAGDQGDLGNDVGQVSLGSLVAELTGDLSRLMRAEIALAKAEAKEEAVTAGKGAGMLAGAGVGGHLAIVFASLALMFALGSFMPIGWGALVVAVIWAVVAGVLASAGRKNLRRASPPMQETVDTLKEDARWAKKPRG